MGTGQSSAKYIKFIIYLVVLVLVNMACTTLFFRVDLTENKAYSLSRASKQVVSNLSEPLTINVFFSKNLPPPHNSIEQYLRDLLEEYAAYANKNFNYRFYNVSAEPGDLSGKTSENQKLAEDYGIHPIQIQAVEKDEIKFQKAYMGLVLIHGDIIEKLATITNTDGLEYKISTAIQKLNNKISALLSLEKKISVKLYFSSSMNTVAPLMGLDKLNALPDEIKATVEKLNQKNYGKLDFTHIDPSKTPEKEKEAEKYNILKLSWPAIKEKNVPKGTGVVGLVIAYQDKVMTVPLINVLRLPIIGTQYTQVDMAQLEEIIDGNIAALINIHEDLGVLGGRGALTLSRMPQMGPMGQQQEDTVNLQRMISETYSIKPVDLKNGIPGTIQCLVIAGPKEKFTEYELFQIDQFLMQGKSLALFLDPYNEIMPTQQQAMMMGGGQPRYIPLETGLEKLLAHYGVVAKRSYVLDEKCFKQRVPQQMGGGERALYFAPLIQNRQINNANAFMANIKGLVSLKMAPLALDEERIKKNNLIAHRLFTSSDKAWEMADQINLNPMFIQPPAADKQKSMALAYLLEGEFPSYFAGKPIPEKEPEKKADEKDEAKEGDKEGDKKDTPKTATDTAKEKAADLPKFEQQGVVISKGKPGKILLLGSSELLKDTLLSEEGRSTNDIFIMNALDYLNGREDVAVMRGKEQKFNPLMPTGPGVKTMAKAINIAGLPILVVIFGVGVWNRRSARKKRIQKMFQK